MKKKIAKSAIADLESNEDQDEATVLSDTAHIPDRDQIFATDAGSFPSDASPYSDEWSGDHEEEIKGERDFSHDLTFELAHVKSMTDRDGLGGGPDESFPTPVGRNDNDGDDLSGDTLEDLIKQAEVLGIPASHSLSRFQLIESIRTTLDHLNT